MPDPQDPRTGGVRTPCIGDGKTYRLVRVGGRTVYAHRHAYEQARGPIPAGYQIDHLCRNPPCANPDHLEAVTSRENTLRGDGPTARQARKTHCVRGHALEGENIAPTRYGRICMTCRRDLQRERRARAREAKP